MTHPMPTEQRVTRAVNSHLIMGAFATGIGGALGVIGGALGLVGLVFAMLARRQTHAGNIDEAQNLARAARSWSIAAFVVTGVIVTLFISGVVIMAFHEPGST